jgi:hypothetical protein
VLEFGNQTLIALLDLVDLSTQLLLRGSESLHLLLQSLQLGLLQL